MSLVLLTNDDGVHSPGIHELASAVDDLGDVWIVAPDIERSACSRAVSLHRPLRVQSIGPRCLAVDGTPTDCVLLAFRALFDRKIDVVISGINHGYNIGEDLDYSGTVAAAAEGALQGAPVSMAISVKANCPKESFRQAAEKTRALVQLAVETPPPSRTFLNVNIPPNPRNVVRLTRQGNFLGPGTVLVTNDPRGRQYYWIANRPEELDPPPDTDRGALAQGFVSVSLLTLDRTYPNDGVWPPHAGMEFPLEES